MKLSDITAGLAGRKPQVGEVWVTKDKPYHKVKIRKIQGKKIIYRLEKASEKHGVDMDMELGPFRFTYNPVD